MAKYSAVKATVNAYIKQNGRKEITGRILNAVLNATIDSLGKYFQFAGGALPTDDPGTPDQNVCYLAGEPGVYTNFGGITIENEEVALLFWDGEWTKQRILIGIREVNASVDNQVGTPSVDVDFENNVLTLSFHNIKGDKGDTGDPAGFGQVTASVDDTIGNPSVQVQTSGEDTAKNIAFEFHGLRGETGITSVVVSVDNTTGNPACSVSLVGQVLHLDFTGLKGLKGDTGVSADYPITIYNGLDSDATDQALAAAQGKVLDGKISQLGQESDYFDTTINGELDNPHIVWQREGYYIDRDGIVRSGEGWKISAPILLKAGVTIVVKTQGQACTIIASTVDGSSYTPIIKAKDAISGLLTYSYCPNTDITIAIAAKTGMGDTSVSFYTVPVIAPVNGYEKDITPNNSWSIENEYITPQGVLSTATGWGISYQRLLKKGQTITIGTQGSGACVVAKPTNTQNYEPLVNIPPNTTGWHEYSYTAEEDITIVFSAKYSLGDASVVVSQTALENRTATLENEVLTLDGRVKSIEVYMKSYSDGCLNYDGNIRALEGWFHNDEFIRVIPGDIIVWNPGSTRQAPSLIGYNANKQMNHYWAAASASRTITVLNDMAFVRCSFVREISDGQGGTILNDTPISVGDKAYKINDITLLNNLKNEISVVDDAHGIIGDYYPEEVKIIENQLRATLSNRFQFLHISDNHGRDFGYAQEFLDYCQAKFLVNTGDMVADSFADLAQSRTIELAQEPTKPVYLVPGNHDYVGAPSKAAVFNAFVGAMNEHNGTSFDKSYYSIDYATEGIKAIFLDGYDGWDDSDYATLDPGPAGLGKMSQTQINWFASELQDAITNSLHVVIFIHEKVGAIDRFKNIPDFYDTLAGQTFNLPFLVQMVDAFMDGTSCQFTYNENSYSFTFSGNGHFVAWIGGHYHGDICGWITGHERQFISIVCRPFRDNSNYSGSYDGDKLGVHFNFCTIDTVTKTFSVYRVGQQSTIYGTPRIAFSIKYL